MKKLSTISLFIFGVVVTAILTAGLVFYQNNKNNQGNSNIAATNDSLVKDVISKINPSDGTITLDLNEIAKHNKSTDCFMLISGKVYDVTSYFGSHPGGNTTMSPTCGTDATAAYATRDPYAKTSGSKVAHSATAKNLLNQYYLGDLNQTIGQKTLVAKSTDSPNKVGVPTTASVVKTNTISNTNIAPATNITLNLSEISKHNKLSDCFLLISGKVYNITSFFGSHPGGNSVMSATCGTDATAAYMTKDPNATSSGGRQSHSSGATSMLASYYVGDLNQSIGQQKITETNAVVAPANTGDDDYEEYDD